MTARLLADDNAALRTTVVDAVSDAEAGTKAVAILAGDLAKASGGRGDAADDAAKQASQAAYAHLDQLFRQWLAQLDPNADGEPTRVTWQRTAKEALRRYGSQLIAQAGPSAWAGRVIDKQHVSSPQAELWFQRNLNRAFPLANLPVEQDSPASEPMASEPLNIKEVVSS
jgi:CRISPR system Cascade subunit CasA